MRRKDTALSFRLDSSLKDQLAQMAAEDDRPLAHFVTRILSQYVERATRKTK